MEPLFRRKVDGRLNLTDTSAAFKVKEENSRSPWSRATSPEKVLSSASSVVLREGRGQVFKWVAKNALGYAGFLVAAIDKDTTSGSRDSKNHSTNKLSFKEYIELFPDGKEAMKLKIVKDKSPQPSSSKPQPTASSLPSLLVGKMPPPQALAKVIYKLVSLQKVQPSLMTGAELNDQELLTEVKQIESKYPSNSQYVQVTKALITKYPFLRDKEGNGYMDRLQHTGDIFRRFQGRFENLVTNVLRLAQDKLIEYKAYEAKVEVLGDDLQEMNYRAALILLPTIMREKTENSITLGKHGSQNTALGNTKLDCSRSEWFALRSSGGSCTPFSLSLHICVSALQWRLLHPVLTVHSYLCISTAVEAPAPRSHCPFISVYQHCSGGSCTPFLL
ncbi:hypothetical protein EOD39_16256 [Acipenser ruthenus]|uniref:Uncharacterized protein n=1 Tax=Acipenser ruthenus TaxID=7906 RepID=A0A444V6B2_ACIRT|nr:hypothetical protein EOD39_16256 [Acipenser ruthenus]